MKFVACFLLLLGISCKPDTVQERLPFQSVQHVNIYNDSTSIRAIAISDEGLVFAGSNGVHGYFKFNSKDQKGYPNFTKKNTGVIDFLGNKPAFRAVATTPSHYFMLSIEQPALLYRYDKESNRSELVYVEDKPDIFYDSIRFWNDQEGIAMGDPIEGCLSIIITRDGGASWNKLRCDMLPETIDGEAAFAASDTNICIRGDNTWIITGGKASNVLFSPNKGKTWSLFNTPIVQGGETTGGYSIDFYNHKVGLVYGGDYLKPHENDANIALTLDGGKTWSLVGQHRNQGYKSCVQFVPGSEGKELVAVGFSGVSYSRNQGATWEQLSDTDYYSIRFVNDSLAFASGRNKIDKLLFKRN